MSIILTPHEAHEVHVAGDEGMGCRTEWDAYKPGVYNSEVTVYQDTHKIDTKTTLYSGNVTSFFLNRLLCSPEQPQTHLFC